MTKDPDGQPSLPMSQPNLLDLMPRANVRGTLEVKEAESAEEITAKLEIQRMEAASKIKLDELKFWRSSAREFAIGCFLIVGSIVIVTGAFATLVISDDPAIRIGAVGVISSVATGWAGFVAGAKLNDGNP